jgi:membrane protein DedA with SNARE-associated domain
MTTDPNTLIASLGAMSYVGIFGMSLLANIVIPIPEEIVVLAIGYVVGMGGLNAFYVIPIIILGLFISDQVLYFGAKANNKFVTLFYNKLFAKRMATKQEWILNNMEKVIFYSRFMVHLRFLGPYLAGQNKVPWKKFITYELAALVVYVPLAILVGSYFHSRIKFLIEGVSVFRNIVLIVIIILILISLSKYLYNKIYNHFFDKKV